MKKILAAVDGPANQPKTNASDMKKFVSIVNESNNRLSVAEQMAVQHFQEPRKDITSPVLNKDADAKPNMIGKYFKKIEEELAESDLRHKERAKQIAERVINKMHGASSPAQQAAIAISKKKAGKKPKDIKENITSLKKLRDQISEEISQLEEYYSVPPTDSKSPIPGGHVNGCKCKEVEEGLRDPKDNPCWKGYKPVGTKKKGGRTVPNCVPKESISEEYPPINVPKGWEAKPQPDGSIRISKIGSMSSAEYKQNMANYKDQNWTPEKIAQHQARTASGQGYTDAEKAANYQQQQKHFGKYADQPLEGMSEGDDDGMPGLSPQMKRAKEMQQIMMNDTPPQDDNLNMLRAWAEYSPHRRIDYYVIAKFGSKGPNRNVFNNSVQETLSAISNFPDMSGQQLYDQFDLDQKDADRLYAAYENVADEFDELSEGQPKGYDSDGNPQGGGYDEYENNWLVTVDGKSWKTFDDEKEAYKAAAAIERKYGKKTRVHKN